MHSIIQFKGNNLTFKLSMHINLKAHFTKHIPEGVNSLTDFSYNRLTQKYIQFTIHTIDLLNASLQNVQKWSKADRTKLQMDLFSIYTNVYIFLRNPAYKCMYVLEMNVNLSLFGETTITHATYATDLL